MSLFNNIKKSLSLWHGLGTDKNHTSKPVRQPVKALTTPSSTPARSGLRGRLSSAPYAGRIFYYFLFAMLFLALYLTFILMSPFADTIILACIFGALVHPLYIRVRKRTGLRDYLAAGLTLVLLVVLFCIPLTFFIFQLIPQASQSIKDLAQWLSSRSLDMVINERVLPLLSWLNDKIFSSLDAPLDIMDLRNSLMGISRSAGQNMVRWGTGFVVDSISIFFNFLLMLLIMFFLLKDGEGMIRKLKQLSPLREEQEDNIIQSLRDMVNAVLLGGFAIAAAQGMVGGIGLALVGIPPLFWGSLMAASALVPVLGTALIWGPATLYLLMHERPEAALFLFIWGIMVTLIDSIARPIILRGKSKISILFLFMSILGGIKAFGPLGLVYGPLILGFILTMIGIYSTEFSGLPEYKSHDNADRRAKTLHLYKTTRRPRRPGRD
ncbi:MAG: AI-2E family transporter [Deltaproteobacteria bacterium]|jgi:predicted PurR-regulated permease PerM|nr:AI-2E family transporter [Deltaproteobacteria bacterium]